MLGENQSEDANKRQERLVELLSTAERLGEVITIRDLLMLVSYFITGGLEAKMSTEMSLGERAGRMNILITAFYMKLQKSSYSDLYKVIPLLKRLGQTDPGKVARRSTDEKLLNSLGMFDKDQLDLQFKSLKMHRKQLTHLMALMKLLETQLVRKRGKASRSDQKPSKSIETQIIF